MYTSFQDKNLPGVVEEVNKLVGDRCNAGQCTSSQCHIISHTVIKKAVRSLAQNKIDQTYNISSSHFINGTELLFSMLSEIITAMFRHGSTNVHLNKGVIKPIHKSSLKSRADSSNYRAISLNSIISKIIDNVIISILKDKIMAFYLQLAYKESFYLHMFFSIHGNHPVLSNNDNGSNVYMLLLDATKAFDRVLYSKLFKLLIENNIGPVIVRLLLNMYLISSAVVSWNGAKSEQFKICNGVRQGGVQSPLLFSLYMNPLIQESNEGKLGYHMGDI